jgi:phage terminase small subunit
VTTRPLTPKQEAFACAFVETGNASEAYRRAYNAAKMKTTSINVNACKLLADANVSLRVAELKAEHAERHKFTINDMVAQLDEDREFARELETPSAAVSASMGKAKVLGFLTDKGDHRSADGSMSPPTTIRIVGVVRDRSDN